MGAEGSVLYLTKQIAVACVVSSAVAIMTLPAFVGAPLNETPDSEERFPALANSLMIADPSASGKRR